MNIRNHLRVLPLAASLLVYSIIPSEALAFVAFVENTQQPMEFRQDSDLAESAIVGIEAFPNESTATFSSKTSLPLGKKMHVLATAYSSSAAQTDSSPFVTASGTLVHPGTLAANFLPFGTRVRIGSSIYTVEDRMNARHNGTYIVDLWMASFAAAKQFGLQMVEIEIVVSP